MSKPSRPGPLPFALVAFVAPLAVGGGTACDAPSGGPIEAVFDPCVPTVLVPASDLSESERDGLRAAVALWRAVDGPPLSVDEGKGAMAPEARALPVSFERAAPAFFGLFRPERADIVINRALGSATGRAVTIAHELGHAYGLAHVDEAPALMKPGNLTTPPSAADVRAIFDRWGACPTGSAP